MAQGIKKYVAKSIKNGDSVKNILSEVKNNSECNWLDIISAFLWWCWLKAGWPVVKWALIILGVVVWVFCVSFIAAVVTACVALVVLVSSPVWMPFCLWKSPEKVAKLLLDTDFEDLDDPKDTPFVISENVWEIGAKVLNVMWRPVYSLLSMSRRQFFIREGNKKLKDYEPATQLAYYDEQAFSDKVTTLKAMSEESMRLVWNRGQFYDRGKILQAWNMQIDDFKLLFENVDKGMFNLLKVHCADAEKPVDAKLQRYFVEQLVGERADRAYEVLKVCALTDRRTLEVKTLTDLITMLGGEHGEQAYDILTTYWERCTLPSEVVEELIKTATESVVDDGKSRAYELLKRVVRRDGITTELAELFFSRCSGNEDEDMTDVINERMDIALIDWECVSATDKDQVKKLTDYFTIRENVSVEGQKLLREWQYVLYRRTNHKLDAEAISYLLVKRLKESDVSFFMQVLDEAWENLSDADAKLMALTPWKRDILIERFAKEERRKGVGQV